MSRSGQPPDLKKYMDKKLQIKLNANRVVVGTLRGFDQFMNLVVDNTVEVNGNDKNDIGMVVTSSAGYQGEQCCHDRSPRTGCQSSVNCQPALVVNKLVVLI
ncbi:hypothetical protein PVAP13_2NG583700 [Panicum virgatum]|uniref:Small nuclear ribonucleoprotein G n=1 Tax=Panicum virgatum TaxID=38727 RepID=A0A8T0VTX9_PANVG|nr:hypothetical protein PVAP13_2NG583700 [Panicum virgatum]